LLKRKGMTTATALPKKGSLMGFIEFLMALPAAIALYATYVIIIENGTNRSGSPGPLPVRRKQPSLHFLEHRQVVAFYDSHRPHVLFHLEAASKEKFQASLGISLKELERSLPWVPSDSSIFVVSEAGFSPAVLERLSNLPTARELYLISGRQDTALLR
jgi:hypothetical protein